MDGNGDVGEDRADDEVDLVALEKALDLRDGHVGLQLVVDDDHLDVASAELAAELLHRELEAVAGLLAEHGRGAGEGQQQADLQLLLRQGRCVRAEAEGRCKAKGFDRHVHHGLPKWLFPAHVCRAA